MLRSRTERFRSLERYTPETLEAFSNRVRDAEPHGKLLETIYNCEYLGFVDSEFQRVGCLLHPCQHDGRDFRSCSFYGAELCDEHLCLSYQKLTRQEKWSVILSLEDWYLYGICITDIDLCKSFFAHASERLGGEPKLSVLSRPAVRRAARDFFALKVTWTHRTGEDGRYGKYCLAEDEYWETRIPYESIGCTRSRYDAILLSLASDFSSADELQAAEQLIDQKIATFVQACEQAEYQTPAPEPGGGVGA